MGQAEEPPPGFEAYAEPSSFLERIGPLLQRRTGAGVVFGVRIAEHHCNRRGMAHGGLIVALADISLGKTGEWLSQPPVSLLTASLTVDFYSAARGTARILTLSLIHHTLDKRAARSTVRGCNAWGRHGAS
jgi:acyl-coenzyme A thioesterase PaaI-like protein